MNEPKVFYPEKRVFVLRPVAITAALTTLVVLVLTVAFVALKAEPLFQLLPALAGLAYVAYIYIDRQVAFSKTRYEIHDDRIVHTVGGLLSENTTNLPFRNVTQIELTLPYLENRFFSTGHIGVHAAGSSSGKVDFTSLAEAEAVFALLEESLRRNGFSIRREKLVQEEEPGAIGVLVDGQGGVAMAGVGGVVMISLSLIPLLPDQGSVAVLAGFSAIIVVAVLLASAYYVVGFIDRKQRVYSLWDDCIEYKDGFLTRRHKIIPFANLADSYTEENFLKRIFGMADIVISCQGTSGDIHFPSMPNAAQFRHNLDRLISQVEAREVLGPTEKMAPFPEFSSGEGSDAPGSDGPSPAPAATVKKTPAYQAPTFGENTGASHTFRINPLRFAIPYLAASLGVVLFTVLFTVMESAAPIDHAAAPIVQELLNIELIVIVLLIPAGYAWFTYFTQRFTLGPRSVTWDQEHVTQKNSIEFTNDKITAITVHRTYLDRLLDTVSITFHSIGADKPLTFKCLPNSERILLLLHQRFGLTGEAPKEDIPSQVSLNSILAAESPLLLGTGACAVLASAACIALGQHPLFVTAIVAMLVVIWGATIGYSLLYHSKSKLQLFEYHLMIRTGLIDHHYTYIAYHDARNVVSTLYPGQNTGQIQVVAGGADALATIEHIRAPYALHERLDAILYQRPMRDVCQTATFDNDQLQQWQPDAKNGYISSTLTLVLTVVGIAALPVALLINRAYYARASCVLQTDCLVQFRGIFFKRRRTVLINRIDQIQTKRNALHNICKNGVVEIYTVGSGCAELTLGPHRDFQRIYDLIRKRAA